MILPLLSSDSPLVCFLFLLCFFFCFFAMVDDGSRWLCCGLQTVVLRWLLCSWSILLLFFPGSLCLSPSFFLAIIVPLTSLFFYVFFFVPPCFKLLCLLYLLSLFRLFFLCSFWVVFIGAKGSEIDPIPALSLRMGSGAFLPCHGVGRGGQ